LLFEAVGPGAAGNTAPAAKLVLLIADPRGLARFTIEPRAPGPLQLRSDRGGAGQLEGFWLDRDPGFRVELALPAPPGDTRISFRIEDSGPDGVVRSAGPLAEGLPPDWISPAPRWRSVSEWLARSAIAPAQAWLVGRGGWVLANSGDNAESPVPLETQGTQQTTWLQRWLYRLVAGSRTEVRDLESPVDPIRLQSEEVNQALDGHEASTWTQDLDTAVVWNTVAVPVVLEGEVRGALVVRATNEGLLLVTNRALGRLLLTTLALTLGLAAGLWYFATRLSRRVQRLSGAVSRAMEDGVEPGSLPLADDGDELGELARNNQKLLQAVADYSQYLQTLASKLSHELKTPLAITRSSLDNLSGRSLDEEAQRFVDRAREGVDRQSAIVRAMSEASRLEAAIGVAEWEDVDLGELVERCVEGYRAVHPGRRLATEFPPERQTVRCAPDLLAQALDKLVDNALSLSGTDDEVVIRLDAAGGLVGLSVRNTGSRLPDDLQERLFDSLVSLREKRGAGPHLGLGLYIVRLVAAAHGGSVSARNLPDGRGVELRMVLPGDTPRQ
jgi:two-component system sensor histidine kinase ChvG